MATYKVPQDVEAEDKLLGPLTLKQLIFALFFFGILFLTYQLFLRSPFLIFVTLPFLIVTGAFAFWQRKDQPIEVFFKAGINFYTQPRKRKWDQDGALKLVEVLAPKVIPKKLSDGRTETEVRSQLANISQTLNSRGWNNRLNDLQNNQMDRIIPLSETPVTASTNSLAYDEPEDSMSRNSVTAQNIQQQIEGSTEKRTQKIQQIIQDQRMSIDDSNTNIQPDPTYQAAATESTPAIPAAPNPIQTAPVETVKIAQAESKNLQKLESDEFEEGAELNLH